MSPKPAGPWYDCPCGIQHPRGCHGHVEECLACEWRGDNGIGRPCVKCAGEVRRRPCRRAPRKGTTVCDSHGAAAPQHDTAIERRGDQAAALAAAGQLAELLDTVPTPTHLAENMLDRVTWLGRMSAEPMSPERLAAAREVVASGMPMANERAADLLAEVDRLRSDQQAIRSVAANMARLNIPDADLLTDAQANRLIEWAGRLAAALSGEHPGADA